MALESLEEIATYIVADGKGILATDESNPTCGKRFDSIGVESTEENRRDYREMLFRAEGVKNNVGGVILFDETIRQKARDGTPLVDLITSQGALPGIKVDKGLKPLDDSPEETVTQGLDGLSERCSEYEKMGAKFAKWRAVIKIGDGIPTDDCINQNMEALSKYAKIVQFNKMVPIVEPEVLMEGNHSIERCFEENSKTLNSLFNCLDKHQVNIKGTLLKPSMVTSGKDIDATAHLDAMNKIGGFDWKLSFSYGRALQQPALKAWLGKDENIEAAQQALSHRALMNKKAATGEWSQSLEK